MAATKAQEAHLGLSGCLLISRLGAYPAPSWISKRAPIRSKYYPSAPAPQNELHNLKIAPRAQKDPMGTPDNVHIMLLSPPLGFTIISYAMLGFTPSAAGRWRRVSGFLRLLCVIF